MSKFVPILPLNSKINGHSGISCPISSTRQDLIEAGPFRYWAGFVLFCVNKTVYSNALCYGAKPFSGW
jgi:hypothetical protein